MADMTYRRLGNAGLRLSVLSFGSWVSFQAQLDDDVCARIDAALSDGP